MSPNREASALSCGSTCAAANSTTVGASANSAIFEYRNHRYPEAASSSAAMVTMVVSSRRRPCATVSSMRLCSFMIFDSSWGETDVDSDMTCSVGGRRPRKWGAVRGPWEMRWGPQPRPGDQLAAGVSPATIWSIIIRTW